MVELGYEMKLLFFAKTWQKAEKFTAMQFWNWKMMSSGEFSLNSDIKNFLQHFIHVSQRNSNWNIPAPASHVFSSLPTASSRPSGNFQFSNLPNFGCFRFGAVSNTAAGARSTAGGFRYWERNLWKVHRLHIGNSRWLLVSQFSLMSFHD